MSGPTSLEAAWRLQDNRAPAAIAALLDQGETARALPAALYFLGTYRHPDFSRSPEPLWTLTARLLRSDQAEMGLAVARWLVLRPGYSHRWDTCEALLTAGLKEALFALRCLACECSGQSGQYALARLRTLGDPELSDPARRAALRVAIQDERAAAHQSALAHLRETAHAALAALEPQATHASSQADCSLARLAIEWLIEPERFGDWDAELNDLLRAPWPEVRFRAAELALETGRTKVDTGGLAELLVQTDARPVPERAAIRQRAASLLGRLGDRSARDALVAALSDEGPYVWRGAAYALTRLGLPEAVPALLAALSSEESRDRAYAVQLMGNLTAPELVPPLLDALSDESVDVRASAVRALGRQDAQEGAGGAHVVPALIAALDDEHRAVRFSAAGVLGRLDVPEVVPRLIEWLAHEDWDGRHAVRDILRDTDAPNVVPALIAALSHENAYVRESAAMVLGSRGAPEAALPLIAALSDEDEDVWDAATEALYRVHAPEAVPALIAALSNKRAHVRQTATVVLGVMGAREAVPPLLAALSDEYVHARAAVMRALGRLGAREAVPALTAALSDEYGVIREAAAQALGQLGAPTAQVPLLAARADPDSGVQTAVTEALHRLDAQEDARAADVVAGRGQPEPVPAPGTIRDVMAQFKPAPAARREPKSAQTLIADLSSDNSSVRGSAARALGRMGAQKAVPALVIALSDQDYRVRISAVEALGRMQVRQERVLLRVGTPEAAHGVEAQCRVRALIHLDPGRALSALERYARQITDESWAPRLRGQALLALGQADAAREELERAAHQEKKRDDLLWLAHVYLEAREPARAAPYLERALERSGHDAISLLSRAVQLWQEQRREAALAALARAQERARHVLYLDDLRYEHFWRAAALTMLQEMVAAQASQEKDSTGH